MTAIASVHAVGEAIAARLTANYPAQPLALPECRFRAVGSAELSVAEPFVQTTLSIYLYRINVVRAMQAAPRLPGVPIELCYMLTAWSDDPAAEQLVLSWAMAEIAAEPTLPALAAGAGPRAQAMAEGEAQLALDDPGLDAMAQIWSLLRPSYRLSAFFRATGLRLLQGAVPLKVAT